MEKRPIRIAQIIGNMTYGGVSQVVMNYYRIIDKNKFQFDFFVYENSDNPFEKEILELGGKIYRLPSIKLLNKFNKKLQILFKENNYKVVHSHLSTLSLIPLRIAKKCHIPIRICHSHSTANYREPIRSTFKYILRPLNKVYANEYFACGEYAGKWMFGKKASNKNKIFIMRNGIDLDKFKFNEKYREEIRNKYNVHDKFILGFIGRLVKQKNPIFLIKLLKEELKVNPNTILMIVGNGELKQHIINKAIKYDILDKIIFVDPNKEVYKYYSCMDVFLLPSLYEGLGLVAIEAEVNGLPSIVSNYVPYEIVYNENCVLSKLNIKDWVTKLTSLTRLTINNKIYEYDIKKCVICLENKYLELI